MAIVIVIALPLWSGIAASMRASFRDHLDVFNEMMLAPVGLLLPLVVVLLTCLDLYSHLAARFVANTRTRMPVRRYIIRRLAAAIGTAAAVFFLYAFVAFLVSFYVWPLLGDPAVDPAGYHLTAAQAVTDSFGRTSYSFLLEHGSLTYGLAYSAWVSLGAAAYAALGVCFLLTVHNRILALGLPFVIYVAGTVVAALLGAPQWGLLYSLFPAGLQASNPLQCAVPTLALILASVIFATIVVIRAPTNRRLA